MWKNWTCKLCTLVAFVMLIVCASEVAWGQRTIGADAQAKLSEVGPIVNPDAKSEAINVLITLVQVLGAALLLLVVFLTSRLARLVDYDPFRNWNGNVINARMFAVFGVAFAAFIGYELYYHTPYTLPSFASVHGESIDLLMNITLFLTGLVFVVTQFLLFFYSYRYQGNAKRKALYYPDNHKLELLWTVVPAVALSLVVLYGVSVWNKIHYPDLAEKPKEIEIVAEQFKWTMRYPGADGELGGYNYKKIDGSNPLGLDSLDKTAHDDQVVFSPELHLVVGKPVTMKVRAKDVLHGLYIPHFAVNVYAVPGMPTEFTFTPTMTTDQMRQKTGNPNFNYELACGQLCGSSHYNMRVVVVIENQDSYDKWLAEQQAWIPEESADESPEATQPPTLQDDAAPEENQASTAGVNQIPAQTVSF